MTKIRELLFFTIGTLLIGFFGSLLAKFESYSILIKPEFAPPNYIYTIVWITLYILMGVSAYTIYRSKDSNRSDALGIYFTQLVVNATWPLVFFGLDYRFTALIWIIVLLILVIIMIYKFYRINKLAGLLQLPYVFWLIFSAILNYTIYTLNINNN